MAYNKYIGFALHVASIFSFLFSSVFIFRIVIPVWMENMWMIPIFVFGIPSISYVGYSIRSYGEVLWRLFTRHIGLTRFGDVMKEHYYESIVLPSDCDVFNHMNNSRYSREADFARTRFYADVGLIQFFQKGRNYWIMTASVIRYRRSLDVFQRFRIVTQIMYWDEKNVYLQHKFTTTATDGSLFVNAIILSQMRVFCEAGAEGFLCLFLRKTSVEKPPITPELQHFLDHIQASSDSLKRRD